MNLFSLSLKNVKKSIGNYLIYFASIIFGVFVFFSFKSIQYNDALIGSGDRIKLAMNSSSIVIIVFIFGFIYYSNNFFIRRRKREVGTYSLLGMRKNQIGKIFFYESCIIGGIAVFLGIFLGFIFSKLMTMILIKLMGNNIVVNIDLSINAVIQTTLVFVIIFAIIGIRNNIVIRKSKIIDLFKKEKEIFNNNKKLLRLKGFLGILLIAMSYYISNSDKILENIQMVMIILILIIPGTFLFFSSAISLVFNWIKKNKNIYYKGQNLIAFSELTYKLSSNSKILSIIAILVATSVTALGFTMSVYYDLDKNIKKLNPFSYSINISNDKINYELKKIIDKDIDNEIIKFDMIVDLIVKQVKYDLVRTEDKSIYKQEQEVHLIRESDIKKIMGYEKKEYINLKDNSEAYYCIGTLEGIYEKIEKINLIDQNKDFNIKEEYFEQLINDNSTYQLLVLKDDIFEDLKKDSIVEQLRIIDLAEGYDDIALSKKIEKMINENIRLKYPFIYTSRTLIYKDMLEVSGLMIFIGMFLSIVFLLCTGSIILFKQLSDIYEDKERYIILKKLGANKEDIKNILSKQLRIIFLLPLLVGTIHNLFAMIIAQKIIRGPIFIPIIITLVLYYIGYFIYYFMTLKYANKMIMT